MSYKTFYMWIAEVDKAVWNIVGLSYEDLPDQPWHDWFVEGVSPIKAVKRAIRRSEE